MNEVEIDKLIKYCKSVEIAFLFFCVIRSTDPKKQKALKRLSELRMEIVPLMEIVAPEYLTEES